MMTHVFLIVSEVADATKAAGDSGRHADSYLTSLPVGTQFPRALKQVLELLHEHI